MVALDGPPLTDIVPAMSAREVEFYRDHAQRASSILEYGSGGSTIIAAECNAPAIYSIDSDLRWIDRLRQEPPVAQLVTQGRARLVHVDIGPVGRWGKPRSKLHAWKWPRYARRPWLESEMRPDLVFIDGLFRTSCLLETLRHAPAGAKIMMHDFSMRSRSHMLAFVEVVEKVDKLALLMPRKDASPLRAQAVSLLYALHKR
jgi:hypothetical protein